MANTPVFALRIPIGTRKALAEIAKREHRSASNLINRVLDEYIEARGFMICPGNCMGHGTYGTDANGDPDLCDTCDGFGYVKSRKPNSVKT